MNENRVHKNGCMKDVRCLVVHLDDVCPGPYGKCNCFELPSKSSDQVWDEALAPLIDELPRLRQELYEINMTDKVIEITDKINELVRAINKLQRP